MSPTVHALRVLSRARWRIIVNRWWRVSLARKIGSIITLGMLLVGLGLTLLAGWGITNTLNSPRLAAEVAKTASGIDFPTLLAALPSALMLGILVLATLSSIGGAISALFFSNDLEFLLTAPIPVRSVFIAKLVESLVGQYLLLLFLAVMPLIGYGLALGYGLAYFLILPLIVLATPLMPTALGAFLAVLILRIVPARRAREILGVFGSLVGFGCYFGSQLLTRSTVVQEIGGNAAWITNLDRPYLPNAWAGRALRGVGAGDWRGLGYALIYIAAALLIFYGGALLTERMYHSGWLAVASSGETRRKRKTTAPARANRQFRGWRGQAQTIFRKDLRVLPRDLRNLIQFIWPLAFAVFWLWRIISDTEVEARDPLTVLLSGVGVTFFICSSISGRLAQTGISREGRAYWLLQVAPINARTIVWSKAVLAWLPFPIFGLLMMVLTVVVGRLNPLLGLLGWLVVLAVGAGMTSIQTSFGAAFPVLNWEQPEKMISARAGCLGSLFGWIYAFISVGLIGLASLPLTLPILSDTARLSPLVWIGAGVGLLGALLITGLALWLPVRIGAERLERLEG
jgi:ABC-2 type transport system permease protein